MTEPLINTVYYTARWKEIGLHCESFEEFQRKIEDFETNLRVNVHENNKDKLALASNTIKKEIFPTLLPAIETMLLYACQHRLLIRNRTIFNGIDNIVEILWNQIEKDKNEEHEWQNIFQMDRCKEYLADNPRPLYPLSCMITKEEAATIIQSFYRGYLVRKIPRIQRFRKFWARVKDKIRRGIPPTPASSEASLLKRCVTCFPKKYASSICSTESLQEAKLARDKENKRRAFLNKCRFSSEPTILEVEENNKCTKDLKF